MQILLKSPARFTQIYYQIYSNLLTDLLKSNARFAQFYYRIYSILVQILLKSVHKFTQFPLFSQRKVRKIQQIILSKGKKYIVSESLEASLLCCSTQINNTKGDTSEKKYRLNVTVWHKLP